MQHVVALQESPPATAVVDVVVPVHDEQAVLAATVRRLHEYLSAELPFAWRIVIADNASTDETPRIAASLAEELPDVGLVTLPEKGRGRALREAWRRSDAEVVCYMDADLSTDLRALLPLLAPLVSGHSDVAIGTRLAAGARVTRSPRRELISRAYNGLLHATLGARFSDAQCGFKALRADAADRLLPAVRDDGWFFDTELLVLAQRQDMRVHEVPVDWVEDADSRVDIVATALGDLAGIGRLLSEARLIRFMAVGVLSTVAYALLYLLLRGVLGAEGANAAALAITAVARQQAMGALVYVLTLGLTSGALVVLQRLDHTPSRALELAVLIAASACATVTRYVALRAWVFAPRRRRGFRPLPT
jgi:glycosyltransferase involved in cell wall biosynthesis